MNTVQKIFTTTFVIILLNILTVFPKAYGTQNKDDPWQPFDNCVDACYLKYIVNRDDCSDLRKLVGDNPGEGQAWCFNACVDNSCKTLRPQLATTSID